MTLNKFIIQLLLICSIITIISCEQDMADNFDEQSSLELRGGDTNAVCDTLIALGLTDSIGCDTLGLNGGYRNICRELVDVGIFGNFQECCNAIFPENGNGNVHGNGPDHAQRVCDSLVSLGLTDSIGCDTLGLSGGYGKICKELVEIGVFGNFQECRDAVFPGNGHGNNNGHGYAQAVCDSLISLGLIDSIGCDTLELNGGYTKICKELVEIGIFGSFRECRDAVFPGNGHGNGHNNGLNNAQIVCDSLISLGLTDSIGCDTLGLSGGYGKICKKLVELDIFDGFRECREAVSP